MVKDEAEVGHAEHGQQMGDPHHDYLIRRHGTADLVPLPSIDPADPLNWPEWRKNVYLGLVAFHGFQAGFLAAGQVSATGLLAVEYGRSVSDISYLVSSMVSSHLFLPCVRASTKRISRSWFTEWHRSSGFQSWHASAAGQSFFFPFWCPELSMWPGPTVTHTARR